MRLLEWPGLKITKLSPYYEWAYIKAHLEGEANERADKIFEEMFGVKPKAEMPYWMVRLAIYYGALEIGHRRLNRKINGTEAKMLRVLMLQDENKLRNDKDLWHTMYLHDVEPAVFGGRERVGGGAK